MLFISPHAQYLIAGVTPTKEIFHERTGTYMGFEAGIDIAFQHGGTPEWAVEQALANDRFQNLWSGLPDGQDRRTAISCYDTDKQAVANGWPDEIKDFIEDYLLGFPEYGQRYVLAVEDRVEAPWPNYDETHHNSVATVGRSIGADPAAVLAYERQQRNRTRVLELVEAWANDVEAEKLAAKPPEEILVNACAPPS